LNGNFGGWNGIIEKTKAAPFEKPQRMRHPRVNRKTYPRFLLEAVNGGIP
jgi:hypothetical protein